VTLNNGSAVYVGPLTGWISDTGGGTVTQVPSSGLPFQFSGAGSTLQSASTTLGGLSTTGTIAKTSTKLALTGTTTGTQTNVFDVNASGGAVSTITSVVINAPLNAVVVVNLQASTLSLSHVTVTLEGGITASLTLDHDTISGTVLAPIASVTTSHLVVTGGSLLVNVANFANDNIT
jgi:choice-of-anchor A domain-containing protein